MFKEKVEYIVVNHQDIEALVKEKYGLPFDFVESTDCGNDSLHSFEVHKGPLQAHERDAWVEMLRNPEGHLCSNLLMRKLCIDGCIAPGNYLVSVCW